MPQRRNTASSSRGAVILEAAISIFLLFLLFAGVFDFGNMFRERQVVKEATRIGVRAAVEFPPIEYWGLSAASATQLAQYRTARLQAPAFAAANYLARQGLDPQNYYIYTEYWPVTPVNYPGVPWPPDPALSWSHLDADNQRHINLAVNVTIKTRTGSSRFMLLPDFAARLCEGSSGPLGGLSFNTGTWYALPAADGRQTDCLVPDWFFTS